MYEQDRERQRRLAREKIMYRYTLALERGDIEELADVLQIAEHDPVLERMILEVHAAYQEEEQIDLTPEEIATVRAQLRDNLCAQREVTQSLRLRARHTPVRRSPQRMRRLAVTLQTLAAVIIVGALLGGFYALFASRHHPGTAGGSLAASHAITWKQVASPSPGTGGSYLNHVAALSANDAWAVGQASGTPAQTLIEHWNGKQWSVISSPSPGTAANNLNSVAVVSVNDAWAVGNFSNDAKSGTPLPLIEHWNGKQWSVVSNPDLKGHTGILYAVTATSASDAWAVGYFINGTQTVGTVNPHTYPIVDVLIEHWDGKRWSLNRDMPDSFSRDRADGIVEQGRLSGVAALSANDAWAVGQVFGYTQFTLIVHWNGKRWSAVNSPNPGEDENVLNSVTAVSAGDIWAVGYQKSFHGYSPKNSSLDVWQTLVEHWDGKQWNVVRSPNLGKTYNNLSDVAVLSADDIWAIGDCSDSGDWQNLIHLPSLLEHWDGKQWSVIKVLNAGAGVTSLADVASVPQARGIWMVGSFARTSTSTNTLTRILWYSNTTT